MSYYENNLSKLIEGNSFDVFKTFADESIDVIITDPPYFLSNGGITCKSGRMVSVDKGEWDKEQGMTMNEFNEHFLTEAKRVLKPNGTIWVSGTMHNIYSIGATLQKLEYKILNNITWQKTNPAPNLSCRMFTHSTETILWSRKTAKSKHLFNYQTMKELNNNKQMKDVWTTSTTKPSEKKFGKHPTQKPLELMTKMILASTNENSIILDPFVGSGTTLVAAQLLGRQSIGIDIDLDYLEIAKNRLENVRNENE